MMHYARLQIDFESVAALKRWVEKANGLKVLHPPASVRPDHEVPKKNVLRFRLAQ